MSRAERSSGQASNYFRMDGKAVFGQAVTQMSDSVRRVLDRVGWQASDLHHLVPHQANTRILAAVADQLDLPVERVVSNIAEVGNTVAASIPWPWPTACAKASCATAATWSSPVSVPD